MNIGVICLDCLRVDHIVPEVMPNFAKLRTAGAWHAAARTAVPSTAESVARMMFGEGGGRILLDGRDWSAGVPSLGATWGRTHDTGAFAGTTLLCWPQFHWLLADFGHAEWLRPVKAGIDAPLKRCLQWTERCDRPWFAYIHHHGAHGPYRGSTAPAGRLPHPAEAGREARDFGRFTQDEAAYVRAAYAEGCRVLDGELPDLLKPFLSDSTLLVLTTDHGEMLGENGQWGHGPGAEPGWDLARRTFWLVLGPGIEPTVDDTPMANSGLTGLLRRHTLTAMRAQKMEPHQGWVQEALKAIGYI